MSRSRRRMQAFRRAPPLRDTRFDDVASVSRDTHGRTRRAVLARIVDDRRLHLASIGARSACLWIVDGIDDESQQPQGFPEIAGIADRRTIACIGSHVDGIRCAPSALPDASMSGCRGRRPTGLATADRNPKKISEIFPKTPRRAPSVEHAGRNRSSDELSAPSTTGRTQRWNDVAH